MRPRTQIIVFYMQGCEACDEFKPRFHRIAAPYRQHFPIYILDCEAPENEKLSDHLKVSGVPVTFAVKQPEHPLGIFGPNQPSIIRLEGGIPDEKIHWLMDACLKYR